MYTFGSLFVCAVGVSDPASCGRGASASRGSAGQGHHGPAAVVRQRPTDGHDSSTGAGAENVHRHHAPAEVNRPQPGLPVAVWVIKPLLSRAGYSGTSLPSAGLAESSPRSLSFGVGSLGLHGTKAHLTERRACPFFATYKNIISYE